MIKKIIATSLLVLAIFTKITFAQTKIPNLHIELSFRQLEEGELSQGIHLFDLWCSDGRCDLTILSLNQCLGDRFYPKVEITSNMLLAGKSEGTLQVKSLGDGLLHLEEKFAGGKITYFLRFREAKMKDEKDQSHSRLFTRDAELAKSLVITDFKGNLTKYSAILDKIVTVEYIPITEEYTVVKFDCGALIPGTFSLKTKK